MRGKPWSASRLAVACLAYMLLVVGISVVRMGWAAAAEARANGHPDDVYVIIHAHGWWYGVLLLPPIVAVAWWLRERNSTRNE